MKIDILEAHDRLEHFNKQADYISEGCQDCIRNRPEEFGNHSFYIFAHKREIEMDERISLFNLDLQYHLTSVTYVRKYVRLEDVPTARLIWEPRLTKPLAQTNSMLFKYYPETDLVDVKYIIPPRELWDQYKKYYLTENKVVVESIYNFENNRMLINAPDDDDLSDEVIGKIYQEMALNAKNKRYSRLGT